MKVLNIGSLNIDRVYEVEHFVKPGETIKTTHYSEACGGKGLNQSIALARSGAEVYHVGAVGADGGMLLDVLKTSGVHTEGVRILPGASGHASDPGGRERTEQHHHLRRSKRFRVEGDDR